MSEQNATREVQCEGCNLLQCDTDVEFVDGLCEECDREARLELEYEYGCNSYRDEDDDYLIDGVGFADPGGRSALRAATESNPRNLPCPSCMEPNRLTPLDRARGYQCDSCADRAEGLEY